MTQAQEKLKNNAGAADLIDAFVEAGHAAYMDGGGVRLKSGIDSNQIQEERYRRSQG